MSVAASPPSIEPEVRKNLRYNLAVNMLDGGFFGFSIGFASFVTIIPLFVSHLTHSAVLIGLIPAIHSVGWMFPQLFTAGWVSRMRRYKPFVVTMTAQERLPFLGLAAVAWFMPLLGTRATLILTFLLLIWQGLGAGFTANPWTSMIAKIIPHEYQGTFFGAQAAAANLFSSVGAVLAGLVLERLASPFDFSLCFLIAGLLMIVSWIALALTHEPEDCAKVIPEKPKPFWSGARSLLIRDVNFRWFVLARMLFTYAMMAFAFYIVYAVQRFAMSEATAGIITGVYMASMIVASPVMGWLGDHWSHRRVMLIGALAAVVSALLAWWAPTLAWFYPAFILAGVAIVGAWTIGITMTVQFGEESERPLYIGLSNTLVAPVAILAPVFGGWLADLMGYPAAFIASAVGGLVTAGVLAFFVKDIKRHL